MEKWDWQDFTDSRSKRVDKILQQKQNNYQPDFGAKIRAIEFRYRLYISLLILSELTSSSPEIIRKPWAYYGTLGDFNSLEFA